MVRQVSKSEVPHKKIPSSHAASDSVSCRFLVGIDVGSTTVKTVVRSAATGETLLHDYRRHESLQAETVLYVLQQAKNDLGIADSNMHLFMTGSGGQQLAELLGARLCRKWQRSVWQ